MDSSSASFPPAPRDLDRVVAGRYRLEARCGEGSFAEVYQALDMTHGGKRAVKLLRREHLVVPDLRARFAREIELLARLDHPHIVRIVDHGEDEGQPYFVMPLLRGESLRTVLRQRPPSATLPWAEGAELVRQLLRALEALHAAAIVHRDLKPANAMVTLVPRLGPQLVLIDLGLATHHSADASVMPSPDYGAPAYRAPELWRGEPADVRSDIYSIGALFYEVLTNAPPFAGPDLRAQHLGAEPVAPRTRAPRAQIPETIEALVLRALAKDPADRFASAAAFIDRLEGELERVKLRLPPGYHLVPRDLAGRDLSANAPPDEPRTGPAEEPGDPAPTGALPTPPPRRRRLLAGLLLAAAAAAALALALRQELPAAPGPELAVDGRAHELALTPGPEGPALTDMSSGFSDAPPAAAAPESAPASPSAPEAPPAAAPDEPVLADRPAAPPRSSAARAPERRLASAAQLERARPAPGAAEPVLDMLSEEEVRAITRTALPDIRECGSAEAERVVVDVEVVDGAPRVKNLHGLHAADWAPCIRDAVLKLRFPRAREPAAARVSFTF